MKTVEQMEIEDLRGELNELKLGLSGIGTKDVMRCLLYTSPRQRD